MLHGARMRFSLLIYDSYNAHRLRNEVRQMLHFGSRKVAAELRDFVRQIADKLVADLG